ncbi:MAG: hypothetical protein ACI4TI_02595, partial [Christensenellales bacterium]
MTEIVLRFRSYTKISLNLNNLIFVYDRNRKTIEGDINSTFKDNIFKKFEAMNFNVFHVKNGNDAQMIEKAINKAKTSKTKPNLIVVDTLIGYGSHVEDSEISHGKPFTESEVEKLKAKFGIKNEFLEFDDECRECVEESIKKINQIIVEEKTRLKEYSKQYPKEYKMLKNYFSLAYNEKAIQMLDRLNSANTLSTRESNHFVLNKIAKVVPNMFGGSADVNSST